MGPAHGMTVTVHPCAGKQVVFAFLPTSRASKRRWLPLLADPSSGSGQFSRTTTSSKRSAAVWALCRERKIRGFAGFWH